MTCRRVAPLCALLVLLAWTHLVTGYTWDLQGDYCRARLPRCCPGRDDTCSVPILGTLCYCDAFCNRTTNDDCCPDFWEVCLGAPRPTPAPHYCFHGGRHYPEGHTFRTNCNNCTCRRTAHHTFQFVCQEKACLVRPDLINDINRGNYGWRAANYSFFWGRTLEDGVQYRLGTFMPTRPTLNMSEIHLINQQRLPESFDVRDRWPGMIQEVRDQGDCGASWAFSTAALASDRLAIQSNGAEQARLSPQHMISCQNNLQRGCLGGHLDRAWWYMRKQGVTTERCYPYSSGFTNQRGRCHVRRTYAGETTVQCPTGGHEKVYRSTPPYRISPQEHVIMQEIYTNGPVQATFRVREDFFVYRDGVYTHTRLSEHLSSPYRQYGWHSVRIIGWGVDRTSLGRPIKYWLCANSWGRFWGENGYFRIERGTNECDIEMFIVSVWVQRDDLTESNVIGLSPVRRG